MRQYRWQKAFERETLPKVKQEGEGKACCSHAVGFCLGFAQSKNDSSLSTMQQNNTTLFTRGKKLHNYIPGNDLPLIEARGGGSLAYFRLASALCLPCLGTIHLSEIRKGRFICYQSLAGSWSSKSPAGSQVYRQLNR